MEKCNIYKEHREKFIEAAYVPNTQCTGGSIVLRVPCHEAHYGLCRTRDAQFLKAAVEAGAQFTKLFLKNGPLHGTRPGTALLIEGFWEGHGNERRESRVVFALFAAIRGGTNKFCLCTSCELVLNGETATLVPELSDSSLHHFTAYMLARRFFNVEHPGASMARMVVHTLDTWSSGNPSSPICSIIWRGKRKLCEHCFWTSSPASVVPAESAASGSKPVADELEAMMVSGFNSIIAAEDVGGNTVKTADADCQNDFGSSTTESDAGSHLVVKARRTPVRKRSAKRRVVARKRRRGMFGARKGSAKACKESVTPKENHTASSSRDLALELRDDDMLLADLVSPPLVHKRDVPVPHAHDGGAGDEFARGKKGVPWGPFAIAKIDRAGQFIGYGGTCKCHQDPGDVDVVCKKTLSLSICGGDEDLCRTAIKAWLLLGHYLPACQKPRTQHKKLHPLEAAKGHTEDELDRDVAGLDVKSNEQVHAHALWATLRV